MDLSTQTLTAHPLQPPQLRGVRTHSILRDGASLERRHGCERGRIRLERRVHGLLAVHLLVMGCAGESTPPPQMGQLRQALELKPVMVGRAPDSGLGTSVAACEGLRFVAGAPGEDTAWLSGDGGYWFPSPQTSVGLAVACHLSAHSIVVAGLGGAWRQGLGTGGLAESILPGIGVEAIARQGDLYLFGAPHLRVSPNLAARGGVFMESGSVAQVVLYDESEGFGSAVAWAQNGSFFAVGDPTGQRAYVYQLDISKQAIEFAQVENLDRDTDFGAAVALGYFLSTSSWLPQLIVAAPGVDQVYIFTDLKANGGPRLAQILSPPEGVVDGGGFGRALALAQPLQFPNRTGPQPLWVGDPGRDRVHRFIGDAGEVVYSGAQTGSWFGHSLAVTEERAFPRKLFVGAPRHDDDGGQQGVGAVYELEIPSLDIDLVGAIPAQCSKDFRCPPTDAGCLRICYGGVLCVPTRACASGDSGTVRDGGKGDAGDSDSGVPDAGKGDAGQTSSDGGPAGRQEARFTTCGCSGVGAGLIPLGLLLVARARRARTVRRI